MLWFPAARLKGESVEEDGYRVAAVLKCLSASGEGSWGDLQLLSRAKSVLVLRSKNLAASTISRVENELGYDTGGFFVLPPAVERGSRSHSQHAPPLR